MSKSAALIATRPEVGVIAGRDRVTVTMTWPSTEWMKALTPHAEGHWRTKAPATKWLKEEVARLVSAAYAGKPWPEALVYYTFMGKTKGQWDEANMIQRMKPVVDGLVKGGVLKDDNWCCLHTAGVIAGKDAENPKVHVIVERVMR